MRLTESTRFLQRNFRREPSKQDRISPKNRRIQHRLPQQAGRDGALSTPEVRVEMSGVQRDGQHAVCPMTGRELRRVEVVAQLADEVLRVGPLLLDPLYVIHKVFGTGALSS